MSLSTTTYTSFQSTIAISAVLQNNAARRDHVRCSPLFDLREARTVPRRARRLFLIDKKVLTLLYVFLSSVLIWVYLFRIRILDSRH